MRSLALFHLLLLYLSQ